MENVANSSGSGRSLTLDSVRESLIRQEDTIIFCLIERAKYPTNSPVYDGSVAGVSGSLVEYIVKETEALQAKVGRYESPEENPFFPENLPPSMVPPHDDPEVLHPSGTSININKTIWDMYFNQLLPLFVQKGNDGNYVPTAACDLHCLQDRATLMGLLTFEKVEEMVKRRVEKKAMVFGQEVCLNDEEDKKGKYKVDPSVVSCLYEKWMMPLTKLVEVEYLLRRLN